MKKFYAYLVTEVTGNQVGKIEVGQHLLEPEYKGNGSYTWTVYNFGDESWPVVATVTGRYVGIVEGEDGTLTDDSKALLHESLAA